jgi:hypothetical protein
VVTPPEDRRIDSFERRAIWLAALATVSLGFGGFGLIGYSDLPAWRAALFVAIQAALVGSLGLATLSLVPGRSSANQLERILFWAFALFWLALLLTAVNTSIAVIRSIGEPGIE